MFSYFTRRAHRYEDALWLPTSPVEVPRRVVPAVPFLMYRGCHACSVADPEPGRGVRHALLLPLLHVAWPPPPAAGNAFS